jgi:hypothetical protein
LSPANGATTNNLQPTLDWSTSSNYPAGYQVQVSTTNVFTSPIIDASLAASAYQLPAGLPAGTYFWRVRAFNAASQNSKWSAVYKFTTPGG